MDGYHTNIRRVCHLCGKPLVGAYLMDWAGNAVCVAHKSTVTQCVSCGQFCNYRSIDIGGGRLLCSYCQGHMMTQAECRHVVDFIRRVYAQCEIGEIRGWNLKVMDAAKMASISGNKNLRGFAEMRDIRYNVYVFRQLSKVQFANVLAHELLHIWQYKRNLNPALLYCEGFCNLGSLVVLSSIKTNEAQATIESLLQSNDPIYGEGLRICKRVYDKGGWQAVIKELESNQTKK